MNKLKTILLSESSKFIHLAIVLFLFALTKTSNLAIILLIAEFIYLFKLSKNLLIFSFLLISLMFIKTFFFQAEAINFGKVIGVEDNYLLIENKGKYHAYLDNPKNYEIGMKLRFDSELLSFDQKNIDGNFDYQTYLKANNIKGQLRINNIEVYDRKFAIEQIPEKLKDFINERYSEKTSIYLTLFILGQKDGLSEDLSAKTNKIGISHLFAISGMHLSLIIAFINLILNRFYLKKKTHQLIIGGLLLIYNIITGFTISILRASLLTVALFFNDERYFTKTDLLSFIMIFLLIVNPYYVYNIGFVLSFLISFSIILGKNIWQSDKSFLQVFKIGILANLVSLPLIIELNGSFGLLNIIYNVIFVYIVSFLILPLAFITFFIPGIEELFILTIKGFESLINFSYQANYYLSFYFPSDINKLIYWGIIYLIIINVKNNVIRIFKLISIYFIILVLEIYINRSLTYVRMLDVNQAEAIHIHSKNCDMLIDTGKTDDYNSVINYLRHKNISKIDYLVITHQHEDHYGEAIDIINNIEVKNLLVNSYFPILSDFPQIILNQDDEFICGDINFINLNYYHFQEENNNSIVLFGKIGNDNWLFTGDIEEEVEIEIINKYLFDIDILKVAHHGSDTSSVFEFIDNYNIKYALISVGENNYSHPNEEVLRRLKLNKIKVFRTDESGTVTFYYLPVGDFHIVENYYFGKRRKLIIL